MKIENLKAFARLIGKGKYTLMAGGVSAVMSLAIKNETPYATAFLITIVAGLAGLNMLSADKAEDDAYDEGQLDAYDQLGYEEVSVIENGEEKTYLVEKLNYDQNDDVKNEQDKNSQIIFPKKRTRK